MLVNKLAQRLGGGEQARVKREAKLKEKVDELQRKLGEAGIKSYAQKVSTANGELTSVRVGPFPNKEEAEKVRAKLGKLGLNGSLTPA